MKTKYSMGLILLFTITLLFTSCNNRVEFTRATRVVQPIGSDWYIEYVLVKNITRNNMKQSKIMIAYFDSMALSVNQLLEMPKIKHYYMGFYKSTQATRKVFIENQKVSTYNGNKTYLGSVLMGCCEGDSTKWSLMIGRNLGTAVDYDLGGPDIDATFLQVCEENKRHNIDKDNELVKYYMELKNKK